MELEITCPACTRYYSNPVCLPCSHSVCMACALRLQTPVTACDGSSKIDLLDMDKMSIYSEADSGVSMSTGSRPSSYLASSRADLRSSHSIHEGDFCIICPANYCKKTNYLTEDGIATLPKNRVLEMIVDKYQTDKNFSAPCQMCASDNKAVAHFMCEQCEVFYCERCTDEFHPLRGPLAQHNLVSPSEGRAILRQRNREKESKCKEHTEEALTMYCLICKETVCYLCIQEGNRHLNHDVQATASISKTHKHELSQSIQSLSEKAKIGTQFLQKVKAMIEKVEEGAHSYESMVIQSCDAIIEAVNRKREELLKVISHEKESRISILKDQVTDCKTHLQKTTGLLQYSIEVLREQDSVQFIQVSNSLVSRVSAANKNYHKEMEMRPRVSPYFELSLDNRPTLHEIDTMNFFKMRAPGPPSFLPERCSAENNVVTLVWSPYSDNLVDAYVLEIDDGSGGNFREVYCGPEILCTVDGLHFDSLYNARVKCYNRQGESAYSDCIRLQTAEVAWFTLDPETAHDDILLSEDGLTATCNNFEERVVLGSCGFSKGVHYWEYKIDHYDSHPDPAFGVARVDTSKNTMLGTDSLSWGMFIDSQRSWFKHGGEHKERTEGGITKGSIVGVKLDLNKHTLSYYINGQPHGPIAFDDLQGTFFPAVSLNKNVQISLRAGIIAPESDEESD
ncbi:E3 ubiquitin-protein ligase TRIM9-like [Watersipora subatra]|uniref:E3 ubiquitin-protein ligase TRIM9-like n=1 Tax=Watersipora subatra TaxID=2589382 RepID=UPI00355BF664